MVHAFAIDAEQAEEWPEPKTLAARLQVPSALGDFLMLRLLRESRGGALAVEDRAILEAVRELPETEAVVTSPQGGATLAAFKRLLGHGFLTGRETTVLFLTASDYKYGEVIETLAARQAA